MTKRIIVQADFNRDGFVVGVDEKESTEGIRKAILAAIPGEYAGPDLEVFDEADDDADSREFADKEQLAHGRIFHVGRCKQVHVAVRYAGRKVERKFPPSTRIGRIRRWAFNDLKIAAADANELLLQIAGSSVQPTRDQHVGSFVIRGTCNVAFDLVRAYTINGDEAVSPEHAKLLADLEGSSFLLGATNDRWGLRSIVWPYLFVDVYARDARGYTLRLDCSGYPQAPSGSFWDVAHSRWLPAVKWPRTGARFGKALCTDWQGGTALYIPCDRASIAGHDQWISLYPAWIWDPKVGISRYLEVVWVVLNGDDYVAPAP
jgi:hypothetical protein